MLDVLVLVLAQVAVSTPPVDPCQSFITATPAPVDDGSGKRRVTDRDLATLVDIGRSDAYQQPTPFGISPDGRSVAFVTRQANPQANAYCQKLVVMPVDGAQAPRELDRGGDFIRSTIVLRKIAALPAGFADVVAPRWSPDGKQIAFLRKDGGPTQIWLVGLDGSPARPITASPDSILDFDWSEDGRGFVTATRPGLRLAEAAIAKEALTGYHYDDRYVPMTSNVPMPLDPAPRIYSLYDPASGKISVAGPKDVARLDPGRLLDRPAGARAFLVSSAGHRAWTVARNPERLLSRSNLVLATKDGRRSLCSSQDCEIIPGMWWSSRGDTLYFLAQVGWAHSQTALLRWRARAKQPERMWVTQDAVVGCSHAADYLICAREGAASPRKAVRIDLASGHETELFDPNPDFAHLALGGVQRFTFLNAFGVECYADLVLPPGHRPGEHHPLVVVQYISDGFLRGGTGDEVPVQALAARGFAVLSFARPGSPPSTLTAKTEAEFRKVTHDDLIDRRSVQSALEIAIGKAVATGAVDAARMGISGLSDGGSTVQWALINSSLFKVASMGSCCEDRWSTPLDGGPGYADYTVEMGYPRFDVEDNQFWARLSLSLNADRIHVPIIVQASGNEYAMGLDTAEAFRERGKPYDFYVMSGEPHFKWQPSHRLAMYDRYLDWFSFWLLHQKDCSDDKQEQYARWQAMSGAPTSAQLACSSDASHVP